MKTIMRILIFLAFANAASGHEPGSKTGQIHPMLIPGGYYQTNENETYKMSRFALSVNPLGFVQFGPLINAEFGITKSVVLNAHVRFPSLGLLNYVVRTEDEEMAEMSGIAFGGGILYFFGEHRSKPYVGALLEYETVKFLAEEDEPWEWEETTNAAVFFVNGGYRFRFKSGFFINTGLYLGAVFNSYEWEYTDPDYVSYDHDAFEDTEIIPFGMVEVTVGIEF